MAVLVYLALMLTLSGHSGASYCVCKEGSQVALQKTLDYACGAGADCTSILQNGACYQPNTVQDHCSFAVNSYYQRAGQVVGSCDFAGTAIVSATPPTTVASGCVYPSSPSNAGTGTATPGTSTTTGTGTPTTTTTGTTPTVFGLGPAGNGNGITDSSEVTSLKAFLASTSITLLISCLCLLIA